jgi:hypothetical protein
MKTSKTSKKISELKDIMELWDCEKNNLDPNNLTHGCRIQCSWKCKSGHVWIQSPRDLIKRKEYKRCQICYDKKKFKNNALNKRRPDLLEEWDYVLNTTDPNKVLFKSREIVNWICKNGHKYKCAIYIRSRGGNCPYCANKRASSDNNLLVKFPKIAKEWDYEKNNDTPENVAFSSEKRYHWICDHGHKWCVRLNSRTCGMKTGCPYCAGQKVCKDNCLATTNPELVKEWHISNIKKPNEVTQNSGEMVLWQCVHGHQWKTSVCNRAGDKKTGCPKCSKSVHLIDGNNFDSRPEAYLYLKLKGRNLKMELNKEYGLKKYRCDFYLPDFNTYIEITSYNDKDKGYMKDIWGKYYEKILIKKEYAEKVLCAKFIFMQVKLNKYQIERVHKNRIKQ